MTNAQAMYAQNIDQLVSLLKGLGTKRSVLIQGDLGIGKSTLLKLLKKYPDYIKAVGTNICDKLLIGEKHDAGCDPDMTPLNKKRHIAVNTVFPILFESGKLSTVKGKTFYKWFQKSLEYTVWYISTSKRPKDLPAIE